MPKDTIDPLLERLGKRIARTRQALKLTQAELARRAGVDRPALHAIEAGTRNLSVLYLARIAKALGVPPGSLLDG